MISPSTPRETVAAVLERAADLIELEGRWTRKEMARDRNGRYAEPRSPKAVCWCMAGAAHHVAGDTMSAIIAVNQMRRVTLGSVSLWNDTPGRTQAEVVTALRTAARLAKTTGAK